MTYLVQIIYRRIAMAPVEASFLEYPVQLGKSADTQVRQSFIYLTLSVQAYRSRLPVVRFCEPLV